MGKKVKHEQTETKPILIKDNKGEVLAEYDKNMLETIKNTVAKNATDEELDMFLTLASKYDLDPFQKELWFIKYKGKDPQIFTSRDGFVKIAKRDPDFKQIRSHAVCENDEFKLGHRINEEGELVISKFEHEFDAKDRGKVIGAWCSITYHTKPPLVTYVDYKEYSANSPTWKKNASAMIRKVSEKEACRLSAGISGLHIPEEMPEYYQRKTRKMSDEAIMQKMEAEAHKQIIDVNID